MLVKSTVYYRSYRLISGRLVPSTYIHFTYPPPRSSLPLLAFSLILSSATLTSIDSILTGPPSPLLAYPDPATHPCCLPYTSSLLLCLSFPVLFVAPYRALTCTLTLAHHPLSRCPTFVRRGCRHRCAFIHSPVIVCFGLSKVCFPCSSCLGHHPSVC